MQISIYTWNSHAINDGTNYEAWFPQKTVSGLPNATPIYVDRSSMYPVYAGKKLGSYTLAFEISMLGNLGTQRDQLAQWFSTEDDTQHKLIIKDQANSDKQWYLYAVVQSFNVKASLATVVLSMDYPIWKAETASTVSWVVTSSGATKPCTVGGNHFARPIFTLTPNSAGGTGFAYKRHVQIYNPTANLYKDYPLNVVGTTIETSTLVSGGKMQTDGDDFRVYADSTEQERWLANINTPNTKVWANVNLSPKVELTLSGALSTTATTIPFKITKANKSALNKLPSSGFLKIYDEVVGYSSKTVTKKSYAVTGVTRACKYTTATSHTDGSTIRWLERDYWLYYGNSTLTAPDQTDTYKPILELDDSTNTTWVYKAFADDALARTGGWKPAVRETTNKKDSAHLSQTYTATHDTDADPATVMGMSLRSWQYGAKWKSESGTVEWRLTHPAGITTVGGSGEKYRSNTTWPSVATIQKYTGKKWVNIFTTQAKPTTAGTWQLFTNATIGLGNTYETIRAVLAGSIGATADNTVHLEYNAITVGLPASDVPVVVVGSEISNYHMQGKITNTTTGEYITLNVPMALGQTLTIDCENKTATLNDGTNVIAGVGFSTVRKDWLNLNVGVNTLQFDDPSTVRVTIGVSWRDQNT